MTKAPISAQPVKEYKKLTQFTHARLRTEMYLGSRELHKQTIIHYTDEGVIAKEFEWVPALATAFREIVDNALDEVVVHSAKSKSHRIDVTYDPKSFRFGVQDSGSGIPLTWDEQEQLFAPTILLGSTMSGRNFDDSTRGATSGINGVGASLVGMTSEFFSMEIHRDGKLFEQTFHEGDTNLIIDDPMITPSDSRTTGTKITFKPSAKVFKNMILPEEYVADRMLEIAMCNPQLKLFYNGKRVVAKTVEETLFKNTKPIFIEIAEGNFNSKFWLVPNFGDNGFEHSHSTVNCIPVFDGGVHIDAFKKNFFSGLLSALEKESKKRKLVPNRADMANGLLIYNITKMDAPTFGNQPKTILVTENVGTIIRKALNDDPDFFKNVVKKNPEWIEKIYESTATRTMRKNDADADKMAKRGKKERVEKLRDAVGNDRSKCILILAEGDCLAENTEILIRKDKTLVPTAIKDVNVGDLVITHLRHAKKVTAKWNTTKSSNFIKTSAGNVVASSEHRFLVKNTATNDTDWLDVKSLDKMIHKLCKQDLTLLGGISLIDILDIIPGPEIPMVDISVEDDASFILANGIVSHNSAIAGLSDARDPMIHGGLPLRGKVLNVHGLSNKTIWENDALKQLMLSIGLVPGQRANRHILRYGKVYITTDADEDGKNIAALLVNFFYTLWPELFDPHKEPYIYIFDTPLLIAVKGKVRKYWYNEDYEQYDPETYKNWELIRCKGLAAMRTADWRYALNAPKLIPVIDDGDLKQSLELLFSDLPGAADNRKTWIGI